MFFLRYCKGMANLLFWVLTTYRKLLCLSADKNQLHPSCFSGDIAKTCKFLSMGTLVMPGYTHPKWWYHLVEIFDVYLHAKNTLHHSFLSGDFTFGRILQFDWPTAFLPITGELKFCQIWDWWWNINNNISFHFGLFPGKTMWQNFLKNPKNPILGPFLALFPKLGKNEFSWKKSHCYSLIFQLSTNVQKMRKN